MPDIKFTIIYKADKKKFLSIHKFWYKILKNTQTSDMKKCVVVLLCQFKCTIFDLKIINNMKKFLFILLLGNSCVAQNCDSLIKITEDKMTGKKHIGSKRDIIISDDGGKTGFGLYLMKSKNSIIISITVAGGSCINDNDKAYILFRDGSKAEIKTNSSFNCKGSFVIYFGGIFGNQKILQQLQSKEIETLRVWTMSTHVQKDFSNDQSKEFIQTLNCLQK